MDVFDAIRTRRSVGKVKPEEPPKEVIEKILEAGTWAPTHHRTEPWRFFVLRGKARNRLGEAMAEALKEELGNLHGKETVTKLEAEKSKTLRAPVIIAVAVSPSTDPMVEEVEEIEAVAAAAQNMLLSAHALGLGAMLRTGKSAYRKKVNEFFGLKGRERLCAFIYLGYPDMVPREGSRTPFREKTTWID